MLMEGRLYIGSLNPETTRGDIEREFGKYGSLRDVWLARKPPGFAFIEYDNARNAEQAMRDMDGQNILGSRIRVEPSKENQKRGQGGGRGGGMRGGGGDRRGFGGDRRGGGGGGMRGGPRGASSGAGGSSGAGFRGSRGGRGDMLGDSRGSRGPAQSYSSYSDYSPRGGGGGYRDEPKARYSGDPYASQYESPSYRSRSPLRRRSPVAPPRGREFGAREFGTTSREYASAAADYGATAREYGSPRGYAARDSSRDFDREYRAPVAAGGAGSRYDRGAEFDRYPRYERSQAAYDRPRRSPPLRR